MVALVSDSQSYQHAWSMPSKVQIISSFEKREMTVWPYIELVVYRGLRHLLIY